MIKNGTVLWKVTAGGLSSAGTVVLYDHAWKHITGNHPEVHPLFDEVRQTIINPSAIHQSTTDPNNSVLFFNHNVLNNKGHALSVPVLSSNGIVKTAYFRPINYSGTLLWKK